MNTQTLYCQSCGMPMTEESQFGTESDGAKSELYCTYCYPNGAFLQEETMEEMIESCIPFMLEAGSFADADQAREAMRAFFPSLKRWQVAE